MLQNAKNLFYSFIISESDFIAFIIVVYTKVRGGFYLMTTGIKTRNKPKLFCHECSYFEATFY